MIPVRLIPKLDIKSLNLVKGVRMEGLRVMGDPSEFAFNYFKEGADEIFYQDVVSSLYGRENLIKILSKTANNIFIPITAGGGVKNLEDINKLLNSGADRVSINTHGLLNLDLIKDTIKKFGSSNIVISIDALKDGPNNYYPLYNYGRDQSEYDLVDWLKICEDLGVSEIFISSILNDGTGNGPDFELLDLVKKNISISIVYNGGIGNFDQLIRLIKDYSPNGVSMSSMLHYNLLSRGKVNIDSIITGNVHYIKSKQVPKKITHMNLIEIKKKLFEKGINCII